MTHRRFTALPRAARAGLLALSLIGLSGLGAAHAHGARAHVHGEVELGIAIEGPAIVIEMRTPLDNLVGFERAPRNDVEKNTVDQTLARLRAADHLFRIDPAGNCKLGPVTLDAPVLGTGLPVSPSARKDEHAEMLASFAFNCTAAERVKFIELDLFQAFPRMRQIDAEIATAEGQHKRSLKRPARRLSWNP